MRRTRICELRHGSEQPAPRGNTPAHLKPALRGPKQGSSGPRRRCVAVRGEKRISDPFAPRQMAFPSQKRPQTGPGGNSVFQDRGKSLILLGAG
jgi:hypothetical protein